MSYVYLLGVDYNAEKEAKNVWDAKQKELSRIEEVKKLQAQKSNPIHIYGIHNYTPNLTVILWINELLC